MPKPVDEPQTLETAIDDAMEASSSPEASAVETPTSTETPAQETKEEESYTRIDPKTLPPELQGMHKSLLRDYTKKMQALAKQRKEYEESLSKQNTLPQVTPQSQEVKAGPTPNMSVEEYTAFMMEQMDQHLSEKQEQQFLDKAVAEFEEADERLNDKSPAYDEYMRNVVGTKLDEALEAYRSEHGTVLGFDYSGMTKDLIAQYEQYTDAKAKELANIKAQRAFKDVKRNATLSAPGSQVPSAPAGGMSLDDAIDNAFSKM